jgi:hypothetical protein
MDALDRTDSNPGRPDPAPPRPPAGSLDWIRELAREWRADWDRLQSPQGRPDPSLLR